MKVRFKVGRWVLAFYGFKVRKAYGIKSGTHSHYLLMDFDAEDGLSKEGLMEHVWSNLRQRFPHDDVYMYPTKHGFHAIVFRKFPLKHAIVEMVKTPYIDLKHVAIGIMRGYWFLETPLGIPEPYFQRHQDLEFMVIERVEDEGLA